MTNDVLDDHLFHRRECLVPPAALCTSGRGLNCSVPGSCDAEPERCKEKVLSYVKFLADAGLIDTCVMQLPANAVAAKLVDWMRQHSDEDWIESLDTALTTLDLCGK